MIWVVDELISDLICESLFRKTVVFRSTSERGRSEDQFREV